MAFLSERASAAAGLLTPRLCKRGGKNYSGAGDEGGRRAAHLLFSAEGEREDGGREVRFPTQGGRKGEVVKLNVDDDRL